MEHKIIAYVKKQNKVTEEDLQGHGIFERAHVLMLNDMVFKNGFTVPVEKINMKYMDVYEIVPNDKQLRLANGMIDLVFKHNKELKDKNISKTIPNYCDRGSKWLKSIYDQDIVMENTDYTHQTALGGKEDYVKWENIKVKEYLIPIEKKLVINSKRV